MTSASNLRKLIAINDSRLALLGEATAGESRETTEARRDLERRRLELASQLAALSADNRLPYREPES